MRKKPKARSVKPGTGSRIPSIAAGVGFNQNWPDSQMFRLVAQSVVENRIHSRICGDDSQADSADDCHEQYQGLHQSVQVGPTFLP
ncbi:MAG: hypothetical protein DMG71_21080 [Acidobacteria bacterium]|nr:MAG: hypothetical protein DMG71_21080 [Acidobacteriota bacterium]